MNSDNFKEASGCSFGGWAKNLIRSNPNFEIRELVEYYSADAKAQEIAELVVSMAETLPDHVKKKELYRFTREKVDGGMFEVTLRYRVLKETK